MRRKQDVVKGPRTDKIHVFTHPLESAGKKMKLRFVDHEVTISHAMCTYRTVMDYVTEAGVGVVRVTG